MPRRCLQSILAQCRAWKWGGMGGEGGRWEQGCILWGYPMSPCPGGCRRCPGRCLRYRQRQLLQTGCVRVSWFLCGLQGTLQKERAVQHRDSASAKNKSSVHGEGLFPSGRGAPHSASQHRRSLQDPCEDHVPRSMPMPAQELALEDTSKAKQVYHRDCPAPRRAAELIAILIPLCHLYPCPLQCKASPLRSRLCPSPRSGGLQFSASSLLLIQQHQRLFVVTKIKVRIFLFYCSALLCPVPGRSETSRGTAHFPPALPWGRASSNTPLTVLVQQRLRPSQGTVASRGVPLPSSHPTASLPTGMSLPAPTLSARELAKRMLPAYCRHRKRKNCGRAFCKGDDKGREPNFVYIGQAEIPYNELWILRMGSSFCVV